MRAAFWLLTFVFSLPAVAQAFQFDRLTKYTVDYGNHKHENLVYSNSRDTTYFMFVKRYQSGNVAQITDIGRKSLHQFDLVAAGGTQKDSMFDFAYARSFKTRKQARSKYASDIEEISQDSISRTLLLKIFKNKRKKKLLATVTFVLRENADNLLPVFKFSCWQDIGYAMADVDFGNVLVQSASIRGKGNPAPAVLDHYQELTPFVLEIPKDANFINGN